MEKCQSCGADLEPSTGPGRPKAYCGEGCRRVAEFQIRALVRRIERYELEQRELKADRWPCDEDRQHRLRALRRWIRADTAKLRAILGANNQIP